MTEIERLARVLADNLGDDYDAAFENKSEWNAARGGEPFRDINMPYKGDYLQAVDAILQALREPSDGMVWAGKSAFVSMGSYIVDSEQCWKLMIDAAIAGK